jgi:hypothetical protein
MKITFVNEWTNFLKLLRFVTWYLLAVSAGFYLLPEFGMFLEGKYDDMASSVKIFSIIGLVAIIAIWQLAALKRRL